MSDITMACLGSVHPLIYSPCISFFFRFLRRMTSLTMLLKDWHATVYSVFMRCLLMGKDFFFPLEAVKSYFNEEQLKGLNYRYDLASSMELLLIALYSV